LVAVLYYRNTEANDGTVFLDNNVYIRNNTTSTDLVNDVFSTPGDVLVGGTQYQDQSIYAQSQGYVGGYPTPAFGTSTRGLTVTDSAGNTVYTSTTPYSTDNINTTFSLTGGRTYYVRGRTDFTYPATSTLGLNDYYNSLGSGFIGLTLSTPIGTDLVIDQYSISVYTYTTSACNAGSIDGVTNYPTFTLTKGFSGQFYANADYAASGTYYKFQNGIVINGTNYNNGDSFTVNGGATTVNVGILTTSCKRLFS
jgi:hypothetical protein